MDCQTCTDHMLSNTAAQCFSKQPNRSGGDKTSLTPSALLSTSKCLGILCIYPKPLAHHLTLIPHAAAHTCVCPRGAQCFTPCRKWEANPKAVGLAAELALTPPDTAWRTWPNPWETLRANTNKHQLFSHSSWPMCNILWLMENL